MMVALIMWVLFGTMVCGYCFSRAAQVAGDNLHKEDPTKAMHRYISATAWRTVSIAAGVAFITTGLVSAWL